MTSNKTFSEKVFQKINLLHTTGKNYRRTNHKLDQIVKYYIDTMQHKYTHIGTNYTTKMTANIITIFNKLIEYCCENNVTKNNVTENNINENIKNKTELSYDTLEFANNIIDWYFKCLAFKYNLTKIQPQIPDYIISEINDIAKSIS
jgi:hypothetical protein